MVYIPINLDSTHVFANDYNMRMNFQATTALYIQILILMRIFKASTNVSVNHPDERMSETVFAVIIYNIEFIWKLSNFAICDT